MKIIYLLGTIICLYATAITAMEIEKGRISPSSPASLALNMSPITMTIGSSPTGSIGEESKSAEGSEKELVQEDQSSSSEKESIGGQITGLAAIVLELRIHNTALEHINASMTVIRTLLERQNNILQKKNTLAKKQYKKEKEYQQFMYAINVLSANIMQDRRPERLDADLWRIIDQARQRTVSSKETTKRKKSRSQKKRVKASESTEQKHENKIKKKRKK